LGLLADFDFDILYKPGRSNVVADALSRQRDTQENDSDIAGLTTMLELMAAEMTGDDFLQRLRQSYQSDPYFTGVKLALEGGKGSRDADKIRFAKKFRLEDGLLYKVNGLKPRLCIPDGDGLRLALLHDNHDAPSAGHLGEQKTIDLIHRKYYWPHLKRDVLSYIKSCDTCQRNKPSHKRPAGLLQPLPIPHGRWEEVTMDFIVQLPKTPRGYDAIMVIVDRLTKRAHFLATTTSVKATEVARLYIQEIYRLHGLPSSMVCDRDSKFTSAFWQSLFNILGVRIKTSTAFHPQTDGQTERTNRTLEQILRMYVSYAQDDWDHYLALAEYAYNNSVQASTGITPFYADLGRHPHSPDGLIDDPEFGKSSKVETATMLAQRMQQITKHITESIKVAQECQRKYADQRRREAEFQV
jgi:hypothetical protein